MSINIKDMSHESLTALDTQQLADMVLFLYKENETLKVNVDDTVLKKYELRLEQLEREVNKDKQYIRRETIELVGIDSSVPDDAIEEECIKILKVAKVKVGNRYPTTFDIHAAHRKGRKGNVILKFVNRKFAYNSIFNRANLKNTEYEKVYINSSLCPEFSFLNFAVRKAKAKGELTKYRLKNGVTFIQKVENGPWLEISHVNDLSRNGLTVPTRSY